jgi:hypothetical protein
LGEWFNTAKKREREKQRERKKEEKRERKKESYVRRYSPWKTSNPYAKLSSPHPHGQLPLNIFIRVFSQHLQPDKLKIISLFKHLCLPKSQFH